MIRRLVRALALLAVVSAPLAPSLAQPAREVRIKAPERPGDTRDDFFVAMLDLALQRSAASDGPARIAVQTPANQARALESLRTGLLDVVWTIPTEERERELRPIRVPLEKGLLGWRVLLIRAGDQARFDAVRTLDDLKALVAGQGQDWSSTRVLEQAGFNVRRVASYDGLFALLAAGRIDHFPRGLNEAWAELAARPDLGLAVESGILLRYRTTSYFFTRRDDEGLAARIERGLAAAIADGAFDALVVGHPTHRELFEKAGLAARRVFEIENPLMPASAPQDAAAWTIPGLGR